jgi:mono/diheme cytochrome c family protein
LRLKPASATFGVALNHHCHAKVLLCWAIPAAWLLAGSSLCAADAKVDGRTVFEKNCAPCHGKDGKATTPAAKMLGVKDLTQSKLSDAEIEKQIIEGRQDAKGTQKMPPFKDKLSNEEIKALVKVVKSFRK